MPPARRSPAGRKPGRPSAPRPARANGSPAANEPVAKSPAAKEPVTKSPAAKGPVGGSARPGKAVPTAAPLTPAPAPIAASPALERVMVIGGTAVALALSIVTAIWEVFLSPLYWGAVPLPVSPVLAGLTTIGLIWFTRAVTGSTGLALLPGTVWFVVMVFATMPRHNGSLPLPSVAWMGLVAVLVGSACWTIAGYWLIVRRR